MTLDDREKLGPAEALLLERRTIELLIGTSADEVGAALLAQAREKLPDPERGTGGELIQQRQGRTRIAFRSLIKTRTRRAQPRAAPRRSSGVASLAVAGWEADRQPTV